MARITDEDCIIQVPNRFELVVLAAQRAKQIGAGSSITVERNNDKNTVVALREIAGPTVDLEGLRSSLVDLHRQYVQTELHEDEMDEFLTQKRVFSAADDDEIESEEQQEVSLEDLQEDEIEEDDQSDDTDSLLYKDAEIMEE